MAKGKERRMSEEERGDTEDRRGSCRVQQESSEHESGVLGEWREARDETNSSFPFSTLLPQLASASQTPWAR